MDSDDVQLLGVSHRGIRFLKVVNASGINPKHLHVLRSYRLSKSLQSYVPVSATLKTAQNTPKINPKQL